GRVAGTGGGGDPMSATTATAVVPAADRTVFSAATRLGEVTFTAVSPVRDAATVQAWLAHPASSAWAMADLDVDGVRGYLAAVAADAAQDGWIGRLDDEPVVYTETYDPARVLLTQVHAAEPGDVGMHLLVAP